MVYVFLLKMQACLFRYLYLGVVFVKLVVMNIAGT